MNDKPRYMCALPGCPGEHASKYLCCDFPEHQPGKWVGPLTVKLGGINIGVCDATNYRIAWSHFPEYAEAIVTACNQHAHLVAQNERLREALEKSRAALDALMPHVRTDNEYSTAEYDAHHKALGLAVEARKAINNCTALSQPEIAATAQTKPRLRPGCNCLHSKMRCAACGETFSRQDGVQ